MELIPPGSNFDFVGKQHGFLIASAIINLVSIVLLFTWGLNYGLDFTGGAMVEVRFREPTTSTNVRHAITQAGLSDVTIQEIGSTGTLFLLRTIHTEEELAQAGTAVTTALTATFADTYEILRVESVGSRVSKDLWYKALWTVALATLFMGAYIAFRFAPRFGLGAVIALVHDVLVVLGALVLTQIPFDLTVLAALLTVVGYSINDTIIVSDRIRENLRKMSRAPLAEVINRSLNDTLSRTLITSGTAILVLGALFVFGGYVIRPFAFTLIVGFVTGVYSTIYIAAPTVLYFDRRRAPRATRAVRQVNA
jgi:preprotein translocase subunit SecF